MAVLNAARRGAQIAEGLYVVDAAAGARYVGQSGDISGRLAQHVASKKISQEAADNALRFLKYWATKPLARLQNNLRLMQEVAFRA